jgi:glycine/D-amino acid oxidase-like deaminating enzyme
VYAGAWLDQRNGTIQPFAYARGLALAAARLGASIHCGVEAGELRRDGGRWRLATSHGEIRAETVVVATNVFTSELHGAIRALLGRTYLSVHSVQLASEPLDARQRESVLPQRHSCGDTSHLRLRYFRLDRENRFVIGGPGWLTPPGSATSPSFRLLEADTRRMFPQLAKTRFEYRWFARDTITPDVVPHLYEPCAGLFASLGYNGRGLAIGTGLGSVLARRVLGEAADALPYPTTQRSAVPLGLPAAIAFYFKLVSGRFHGRHR